MEEEDDLERLRLAALKSLSNKRPEPALFPPYDRVSEFASRRGPPGHQKHLYHMNSAFYNVAPDSVDGGIDPRLNQSTYPVNFDLPPKIGQLSPRSAAFVSQNNDILMRRKRGLSPKSPPLHLKSSPGRWSPPPRYENGSPKRSPKRSPSFCRRSVSRTPEKRRTRSPVNPHHRRSVSRSPVRNRSSPMPPHARRSRSRSPMNRNVRRRHSRSPPSRIIPRDASPSGRDATRIRRRNSPKPVPRNNEKFSKNAPPPRRNDYRSSRRKPSRSPVSNRKDLGPRSGSRSPHRNNRNDQRKRYAPAKKLSDSRAFKENGDRQNAPRNAQRTNDREEERNNARKMRDNDETNQPNSSNGGKTEIEHNQPLENIDDNSMEPSKAENEQNDSSDSSSEQSESDVEIDLFASEESESENEGRFKLNSNKTESKAAAPAIAFSKLGTKASLATDIRKLEDVKSDLLDAKGSSKHGARDKHDRGRGSRLNARRRSRERDRNRDRYDKPRRVSRNKFGKSDAPRSNKTNLGERIIEVYPLESWR